MDGLSIERCRELMGEDAASLTDEQVLRMRRRLYELADIVIDAFSSLETVDQSLLSPSGNIVDQLNPQVKGKR